MIIRVKFGYARVSTPGQHLDRQLTALTAFGCDEIIAEKRSAKDIAQRPALQALLAQLRKGDVLVVAEWDRATRSFLDGIAIMQHVLKRDATLRVLDINLDLADPIQQALVGVLSAIAQKERERNLSRAQDGRLEAKRRGVRMGRRSALSDAQITEMLERHRSGETPARLAVSYGVNKSTVTRLIARLRQHIL